ncbi:MAG: radical SAM protein [Planctomycetia bacterium]|nr:radical SAM protein [Planctomycetia bacterium]
MIKLQHIDVKNCLTATKIPGIDFVINPYVGCPHKCAYCYAEFMKRFSNHTEPWGEFLDVKHPKAPIPVRKLGGKTILLSSVTDPYNPFEKQFNATRSLLQELLHAGAYVTILTKSDLVLRDLDLLHQFPSVHVTFSINSLDDSFRKIFEPHASPIEARFEALRILHDEGISTGVFLSPIFPGLSDFRAILERAKPCANEFWFENLKLRSLYRRRILEMIHRYYPHMTPLYHEIYLHKQAREYWDQYMCDIQEWCEEEKIDAKIYFGDC